MDITSPDSSAPTGGTVVLRSRSAAVIAAAIAGFMGCGLANGADVRLAGPACALPGSMIDVELVVDPEGATVVGLQALLQYDQSVLRFVSFDDGDAPYVVPIWASVDEAIAGIDVAVGFDPENAQAGSPVAVAKRIRFEVLATAAECATAGLISFREEPPFKTLLTVFGGAGIDPDLVTLNPLTVSAAPVMGQVADVSVTPLLKMDCAVPPIEPPQVSSSCGVEAVVTFVRSDGATTLDAPVCRLNSPVSITWTATDACGRAVTATQVVTVPGLAADLNMDGMVDAYDLAVILGAWGSTSGVGDINGDMVADGFDLSALLSRWTDSIP